MILLDTCVLSEQLKPTPNPACVNWLDSIPEDAVYIPVFALGELKRGIERLEPGSKRNLLEIWLEQLNARFAGRIVDFDGQAALIWGTLSARLTASGTPMPLMDSLIAACALRAGATLATRNVANFARAGVELLNPWE
ncbi:MAG TPA: type II toxin-antitoxin system VapC family toxin [Treponemataceae bacterium]|nr:type II toxin-antitoxin system VapC family toxin [Treponemataceae bacterium]